MYINTINHKIINPFERYLLGTSKKAKTRTSVIGSFKGINILIDRFTDDEEKVIQKRFVLWNSMTQLVVFKIRKENGKFETIA